MVVSALGGNKGGEVEQSTRQDAQESSSREVVFEQDLQEVRELSHMHSWGKGIIGRGKG